MTPNRMRLLLPVVGLLALAATAGASLWLNRVSSRPIVTTASAPTGWFGGGTGSQRFRGTLAASLGNRPRIPEAPRSIACLSMPGGFYHLIFSSYEPQPGEAGLHDRLAQLDGKTVIVQGRLETRYNRFMGNSPYQCIIVEDFQLAPPSPTTTPGAGSQTPAGP